MLYDNHMMRFSKGDDALKALDAYRFNPEAFAGNASSAQRGHLEWWPTRSERGKPMARLTSIGWSGVRQLFVGMKPRSPIWKPSALGSATFARTSFLRAAITFGILAIALGCSRQPELQPPQISPSQHPGVKAGIAELCATSDGYGVLFQQSFWRNHEVYAIVCGDQVCGPAGGALAAAIDSSGDVFLLTGDKAVLADNYEGINTMALALENFGLISRKEGLIISKSNVSDYLTAFLRLYLSMGGLYLPDESDVNSVLDLDMSGISNAQSLLDGVDHYRNINQPNFHFISREAPFEIRANAWWYWVNSVWRYTIVAHGDGSIEFRRDSIEPKGRDDTHS